MNNKIKTGITVIASSMAPYFVFAADNIEGVLDVLFNIINDYLIPLLFITATAVFLYGVITYLTAGGDETKAETGKFYIIWGIIALFAMVAIWGLVWAVSNTFSLPGQGIPSAPL